MNKAIRIQHPLLKTVNNTLIDLTSSELHASMSSLSATVDPWYRIITGWIQL